MAGITNSSFRSLCREFGAGLYVCEMITTRALVAGDPKTREMIRFGPEESPRSVQLYGVDPVVVGQAVRIVVEEDLADHIDLNFGCPVPKVTRKGGGSALPYKRRLFESIVRTAVEVAAEAHIPVTVKMRIGIDPEHITYTDAGRIAEDCGVAAVALHGRTAIQHYSGTADWDAIGTLKQLVTSIPVLGNGDIFAASDALEMMAQTGCDGVVVGRGCQGRPWLFAELAAAFEGRPAPTPPDLRAVAGDPAPACRTALRRDGSRSRHARPAQTHRVVPQGVRRRVRAAATARHGVQPGRTRHPAGRARSRPAVPDRR